MGIYPPHILTIRNTWDGYPVVANATFPEHTPKYFLHVIVGDVPDEHTIPEQSIHQPDLPIIVKSKQTPFVLSFILDWRSNPDYAFLLFITKEMNAEKSWSFSDGDPKNGGEGEYRLVYDFHTPGDYWLVPVLCEIPDDTQHQPVDFTITIKSYGDVSLT